MIIDVRTRIDFSSDPAGEPFDLSDSGSPAAHRSAMKCVDAAIILGYRCDRYSIHVPMEAVAAAVHEDPDSRLGIAGIDPLSPGVFDDLDQAVDLGLVGVTIAPADQGCRLTHDRSLAVLERCAARKLPVVIANPMIAHRQSAMEFARPSAMDEAFAQAPGLTVILGDLGHGWVDETLLLVQKHERVFAEISGLVRRPWALYMALLEAYERGVMDKLLFGSGFPECAPEKAIERIYTVNTMRGSSNMPAIPREQLRHLVERDTLAALDIDHLVSRRAGVRRGSESGFGVTARSFSDKPVAGGLD